MAEDTTLNQAWGALRVVLPEAFSFYDIKDIVALSGIDVTSLASLVQRPRGGASKGELITALDGQVRILDQHAKSRVLTRIAEEIVRRRPDQQAPLDEYLERLGWQFVDGTLIPIDVFDVADLAELPGDARADLVKAATRLRDGDLDGALTSACAAVDSVTDSVYATNGLKSQLSDGLQARYSTAIKTKGVIAELTAELNALGWNPADAEKLAQNFRGALNHGAYVMQTLRSRMGDVHGSKPALKPLVFDSLKWAALLVRVMK